MFVRLRGDGAIGFGEAAPSAYYGESAEQVLEKLTTIAPLLTSLRIRSVADIERSWENLWNLLSPSRAAQCALDLALWDWLARKEGVSVTELAWGRTPRRVRTFCTIGLSSPEEFAARLKDLLEFPLIKIKSDDTANLEPVRQAAQMNGARVAVDANCAWSGKDLHALGEELTALKVEFIEQPLPPEEEEMTPRFAKGPSIMADESCVILEDVERIAHHFDGFNIKLVKCGGLTPGLKMARLGRELGLKTMVGCMLESSALISAGAVVAQGADYADLDGAWLLRDDPFAGWEFSAGVLQPPVGNGLGTQPLDDLFS